MFTGCVEAGVKTFLVDDGQDCSSWLSLASANLYYGSADGGKLYDEEASSFGRTEVGEFVRVSDGDEFQDLEQKCVSTTCMQPTAEDDLRNCEGVGLVQVISPLLVPVLAAKSNAAATLRSSGQHAEHACCEHRITAMASGGLAGTIVVDATDWSIIPAENLVAAAQAGGGSSRLQLLMVASTAADARTLLGALEKGVDGVVLATDDVAQVCQPMPLSKLPLLSVTRSDTRSDMFSCTPLATFQEYVSPVPEVA